MSRNRLPSSPGTRRTARTLLLVLVGLLNAPFLGRPGASQPATGNLWNLVAIKHGYVAEGLPGLLTYRMVREPDLTGGSLEVTVKGELDNWCPKGTNIQYFDWTVTGDSDGIKTVGNGETFSVNFEARGAATPPCPVGPYMWIETGGHPKIVTDATLELFENVGAKRFYPAGNWPPPGYHTPGPRQFTTTTRHSVRQISRGQVVLQVMGGPWLPALQIAYVFEAGSSVPAMPAPRPTGSEDPIKPVVPLPRPAETAKPPTPPVPSATSSLPPVAPRRTGDCDGDGRITSLDARCALEMSVQLTPVRLAIDVDDSKDVTSRDAVVILQRAVGK